MRTQHAFPLAPLLNFPLPELRFASVCISGWPLKEIEYLLGISNRKSEFAWGLRTPGAIFTFRHERKNVELRAGDCCVAANLLLLRLQMPPNISSEEEARVDPFISFYNLI